MKKENILPKKQLKYFEIIQNSQLEMKAQLQLLLKIFRGENGLGA